MPVTSNVTQDPNGEVGTPDHKIYDNKGRHVLQASMQSNATPSIGDVLSAVGIDVDRTGPSSGICSFVPLSQIGAATWFETLALMGAAAGPASKTVAFCAETAAEYEWFPGSVTTVDGWLVIANTGGTNGRWIVRGSMISIAAIDGIADDTVRLNSAIAACAYKVEIHMRAGTWIFADQGGAIGGALVLSGTTLHLDNGAVLRSTQTKGAFLAFVLQNIPLLDNGVGVLTAAAAVGSNTIPCSITIPAGTWIWVGQTAPAAGGSLYVAQQYQVQSVAGGGPFTLTLDRPVLQPFPINTRVQIITRQTRDIVIHGNGATLEGEADRLIQLQGAYRCEVNGPLTGQVGPSGLPADYMMSFDLASLESQANDLNALSIVGGFAMESCERVTYTNCSTRLATTFGMRIRDSVNVTVIDCSGSGYSGTGIDIRASDVGTIGCFGVRVFGGRWDGTGGASVGVSLGVASGVRLYGVTAAGNATNFSQATTTVRPVFNGCISERATTQGFQAVAPYTRWIGCTSHGDARGFRIEATSVFVECSECDVWDYTIAGIRGEFGTGELSFVNGVIGSGGNGTNNSDLAGPDVVTFDNSKFIGSAGGPAMHFVRAGAGVQTFKDCEFRSTSGGTIGYISAAANTCRLEGRNDFTGVTTPLTINAASFINRFSLQLTAAVPLVVAWPDLKNGEYPLLTRTIIAGGTGLAPLVTVTPGTGFTITGAAADTDTYHVEISP